MLGMVRGGEKVTWVVTGWDERVAPLKKSRLDVSGEEQGSPDTPLSETTPPVTEREQGEINEFNIPPDDEIFKQLDDQATRGLRIFRCACQTYVMYCIICAVTNGTSY
ncbi:hypothetical protein FACS1894216_17480 [Synergistales bacterium]|nr:hypothetical protein FACS1894216_17480 [Synergistales bacterium]